ncbi:hypothetical protein HPDFL43_08284 [Hoeflea phototrophica DFL-43]|jgi:hypothetical protein|uniref:DUF4864 domain-containing protein n=1 Tax=Hoeflea phototrophica (strain DSM 17068 / NCIMB 14078 / DFL-43) TaxID=411684 RepID=A9D9F8_HOEPD|nr:DUF4864 domain-containing protein [Hoeflea phototrophica]EDQ32932.1 hypothetical protein HPDFL43_08284 [Hoeflea phototrophica DFL-43]
MTDPKRIKINHRIAALVAALVAATLLLLTPARADDAAAAQSIIESQIQAFLADDMATAYSFAAPSIKRMYPDESRFFDMVKRGYQPVYRPGNFAFGRSKLAPDGSGLIQEVLIQGPDGQDWTALYSLERQPDGSFKINGVQMIKAAAPVT